MNHLYRVLNGHPIYTSAEWRRKRFCVSIRKCTGLGALGPVTVTWISVFSVCIRAENSERAFRATTVSCWEKKNYCTFWELASKLSKENIRQYLGTSSLARRLLPGASVVLVLEARDLSNGLKPVTTDTEQLIQTRHWCIQLTYHEVQTR